MVRGILSSALVYTALVFGANTAMADMSAISDLREGDMRKLILHNEPRDAIEAGFETVDGAPMSLAEYEGKIVVLNFWATWCAPCRHEMPSLSALEAEFGGDDFAVVTVATGRNPVPAMEQFFTEIEVDNLPLHKDPTQAYARQMGVLGLPMTMIIDAEGREIGRMIGDADWHSDSARAVVSALIEAKTASN